MGVWNRLRIPNMAMTLMPRTADSKYAANQYAFKVDPKFTKLEIKEYLQKVYNVEVKKVNTINYDGKVKRAVQGAKVFREKAWKKAIVTVKS